MSANQAPYRSATMCRMLGVSPSGYYAWRRREASVRSKHDAQLKARIQALHSWSRGSAGHRVSSIIATKAANTPRLLSASAVG